MDETLGNFVRERAQSACEYCGLHQRYVRFTFPIDHIIARQHGGGTAADNLALACPSCNSRKGPNIAGIDPKNVVLTRLFNPRTDLWAVHFKRSGTRLVGLSDVGRTTIAVLAMNNAQQIAMRSALIEEEKPLG